MDQTAFEQALREEIPNVLKALRRVFPTAALGIGDLAETARLGRERAPLDQEQFFNWLYSVAAGLHAAPEVVRAERVMRELRDSASVRRLQDRCRRAGVEMEDVLQQAWLKLQGAITHGSRVPQEADEARAWCYRTIESALIEFERRNRRRPAVTLPLVPDSCTAEKEADEVQRLQECIERLPPDERTVIRMRLQRYTLQEIADELGLRHPSAVQRMEAAAQGRLRNCLSE